MKGRRLHPWDMTPRRAIEIQRRLAVGVIRRSPASGIGWIRLIAGIDVSVKDDLSRAAVVVVRFPDMTPVEQVTAERKVRFPYVPGLLSFREAPVIVSALKKLKSEPDLLMIDGQGYAHPRRFGIA